MQDSLDQCPLPINSDQNHGIDLKCLSMPIISDQFLSMRLRLYVLSHAVFHAYSACSGIDWNWSEWIDIWINARNLIGFDRHWPLIEGVLKMKAPSTVVPSCWEWKNLGRPWLAYTELQGDFCMLRFISVDSRHFTQSEKGRGSRKKFQFLKISTHPPLR